MIPSAPELPVPANPLAAEIQALRDHIRELEAQQAAVAEQQAGTELYEQRPARFRTVFENSPLGQKIIAPDLTIRQPNPALLAMLGCTRREQVEGRRILDFTHPHYRVDWHHLQEQLWTHKLPYFTLDTCLVRADGSSCWCQVPCILLADQGQELGYMPVASVIHARQADDCFADVDGSWPLHFIVADTLSAAQFVAAAQQQGLQLTVPQALVYWGGSQATCVAGHRLLQNEYHWPAGLLKTKPFWK